MQKLGQHFLINKTIIAEILRAGEVSKKDIILEVGPGKGILTEALAEKAKKVIAVEKDKELVRYLKDKFSKYLPAEASAKVGRNIEIIHGDILKINSWHSYVNSYHSHRIKIIANIPYYITSRFLRIFLSQTKFRPKMMVLMIQKEVAERIVGTRLRSDSRVAKESLLSLSVKAYGKPEIIKIVRKGNFYPPPKVDSAIIKISDISDKWFVKHSMFAKKFFEILRKAFQQKRKMLRHSLGKNLPENYQNKRPEELELEDWKIIYLSQSPKSLKP